MNKRQTTSYGFSLVELLIVIAIIGLLTTVIIANVSSGRTKAQTAQILSDFQSRETALTFMALNHSVTKWWTDDDNSPCKAANPNYAPVIPGNDTVTTCLASPNIVDLIANSPADGLKKYLSTAPTPPVGTGKYQYDRDSADIFDDDDIPNNNCAEPKGATSAGTTASFGALLLLWGMVDYPEIFDAINMAIDGEESLSDNDKRRCGRIRYVKTSSSPPLPPSSPSICTGVLGENCAIFYMLSGNGKF
jgi:prepilin-type N-terminal cleavage/methylation domain-containing protein